jgi:transcriptional regulator with XRE-family HTH domain
VQRGAPGSGVSVEPSRVRQARMDAGLSLADVAGEEVSRTFIHFVESGQSRPSRRVLELIAQRTGKPLKYFVRPKGQNESARSESSKLALELVAVAGHVERFVKTNRLTRSEREAMLLVEGALHQAAALARSIKPEAKT